MGIIIPPKNSASPNKDETNLTLLKLQRLQNQHLLQLTSLAAKMSEKYNKWVNMSQEELIQAIKKEEALLDSIQTAMKIETILKKENEAYEAEKAASVKKALNELLP